MNRTIPSQPRVLIADDQVDVLEALNLLLKAEGFQIDTAEAPSEIMKKVEKKEYDVVLMDLNYTRDTTSGEEGLDVLNRIQTLDSTLPVIVMTAWGSVDLAVEAIRRGAKDFIQKPWDNERLFAIVRTQIELGQALRIGQRLEAENELLRGDTENIPKLIAEAESMKPVLQLIRHVGPSDANVLILGENGSGKSLVAQALHAVSSRASAGMVTVNVGGLSEGVFESELFGHVKGAYTDAKTDRVGRFELADKGTLFLDEIANVPPGLQTKLLRILETGDVGGISPLGIVLELSLAGYYPFNANANDESGNNRHGTVNSATLTTDRDGNPNSAYSFSNTNINIGQGWDTPDGTVAMWIYQNNSGGVQRFLSDRSGSSNYLSLFVNTANEIGATMVNGAFVDIGQTMALTPNQWYHVAYTWGAGGMKLYINGILHDSDPSTQVWNANSDMLIGNSQAFSTQGWQGKIDDVRLYSRALTAEEIEDLVEAPSEPVQFTEVGAAAGVNDGGVGEGMAWGDYDSDGDLDFYVANNGASRLYRNNDDGTFTEVGNAAGVDDAGNGQGVAWGDYDNDGDLDLYLTNATSENRLYQNNGNGTFTEVGTSAGVNSTANSRGAAWGDYDNDGDLDLYLANAGSGNLLYRNNSDGTFTDIGGSAGVDDTGNSWGVTWGDYDNDGDLDLYVANAGSGEPNRLYQNNGDDTFSEIGATAGVDDNGVGIGVTWGD